MNLISRWMAVFLTLTLTLYSAPVAAEVPSRAVPDSARSPAAGPLPKPSPLPVPAPESAPELAADPDPAPEPFQASDIESELARLRAERDQIDPGTGRAKIITGNVMLGVGLGTAVVAGAACAIANTGSNTECRTESAIALGTLGGGMLLVGLIVGSSGRNARTEAKRERSALELRIQQIEEQRRAERVGRLGFGVLTGEHKGLVIGWTY